MSLCATFWLVVAIEQVAKDMPTVRVEGEGFLQCIAFGGDMTGKRRDVPRIFHSTKNAHPVDAEHEHSADAKSVAV